MTAEERRSAEELDYLRRVTGEGKRPDPKIFRGDNEALPGMSFLNNLVDTIVKPAIGAPQPQTRARARDDQRFESLSSRSPYAQAPPIQVVDDRKLRELSLNLSGDLLDLDLWNKMRGEPGGRDTNFSGNSSAPAYRMLSGRPITYAQGRTSQP
jgi:hypothetical protein